MEYNRRRSLGGDGMKWSLAGGLLWVAAGCATPFPVEKIEAADARVAAAVEHVSVIADEISGVAHVADEIDQAAAVIGMAAVSARAAYREGRVDEGDVEIARIRAASDQARAHADALRARVLAMRGANESLADALADARVSLAAAEREISRLRRAARRARVWRHLGITGLFVLIIALCLFIVRMTK